MDFSKPAKAISGEVVTSTSLEIWPYDNGDQYWSGGSKPRAYKWTVDMAIATTTHSSQSTRENFIYDGNDVNVGDFVANTKNGFIYRIASISLKSPARVVCVLEDVNRVNTFSDPSKNAIGAMSTGAPFVVFKLNSDGAPVITTVPDGTSASFFAIVASRFAQSDIHCNFPIKSADAAKFKIGDFVSVTDTGFDITSSESPTNIGVISYVNVPAGFFMFDPNKKVIHDYDFLPGAVGSTLYSSIGGGLSTAGDIPVIIKLKNNTKSKLEGTNASPSTAANSRFKLNGVTISAGSGSAADVIAAINLTSSQHGVAASSKPSPTVAQTSLSMELGEPAIYVGGVLPKASINGVEVTFKTYARGMVEYGDKYALEDDMVVDINNANIPNIVASKGSNKLILTNTAGGAITIVNITNSSEGTPFAGPNSGSGIPLNTAASTGGGGGAILIEAVDARPIVFSNVSGTPVEDLGLFSVENGEKAAGIYIGGSSGIRSSSSTVVSNIPARDALTATIGDSAMVIDKGDGEWGLYLHNGSQWLLISSEESARTDARTVTVGITPNSPTNGWICEMNGGNTISSVAVNVVTPFDAPIDLFVGDATKFDRIMTTEEFDASTPGRYLLTPNIFYAPRSSDVEILFTFNANGATVGDIKLSVTYV